MKKAKLHDRQRQMRARNAARPQLGRPPGPGRELRQLRVELWRLVCEKGIAPEIAGQVILRHYGAEYLDEVKRFCSCG